MNNPKVIIIAPCFNEGQVVIDFLDTLAANLTVLDYAFEVVIVDDASYDDTLDLLKDYQFAKPSIQLTILHLEFNLGHQGAILQGLLYASKQDSNQFIIMDSDGQDDPIHIKELLETSGYDLVQVKRGKRGESVLFKLCYQLYLLTFRMITGKKIDFGNFSMINLKVVRSALHHGFFHYPSFLSKQKVRSTFIKVDRLKRLGGRSKMKFADLLQHAIRSFIEYAEELLTLCIKTFVLFSILLFAFGSYVLYSKLFTYQAILGWASTVSIGLINAMLILISAFSLGSLLLKILHRRQGTATGKNFIKL